MTEHLHTAVDTPWLAAEAGIKLLANYERDGRPEDLAEAIRLLQLAVELMPLPDWQYCLAMALAYRGDEAGPGPDQEADRAAAQDLFRMLLDADGVDLADRAEVIEILCEFYWLRCEQLAATESEVAAANELIELVHQLRSVADGGLGEYLPRAVEGSALAIRHNADGDPADLLQGIRLLEAALPKLPVQTLRLAEYWNRLAAACLSAKEIPEDRDWVNLAVSAATEATRVAELQGEEPTRFLMSEGQCRTARWSSSDPPDPADLDRAIVCYELAMESWDDEFATFMHGDLLRERGVRTDSAEDLALGIISLRRALFSRGLDDETRALYAMTLAEAHEARWELCHEREDLEGQLHGYRIAIGTSALDAGDEASSRWGLLEMLHELTALDGRTPELLDRLEAELAAADQAADRLEPEDAEAAALLAGGVLYGYSRLSESWLDRLSPARLRELGRIAGRLEPEWEVAATLLADLGSGVSELMSDVVDHTDSGFGIEALIRALRSPMLDDELQLNGAIVLAHALMSQAIRSGNLSMLAAARELALRAAARMDPAKAAEVYLMAAIIEFFEMAAMGGVDDEVLTAAVRDLVSAADAISAMAEPADLALLIALLAGVTGIPGPAVVTEFVPRDFGLPPAAADGFRTLQASADLAKAMRSNNPFTLRKTNEKLAGMAEQCAQTAATWPGMCFLAGLGHLEALRRGDLLASRAARLWNERALSALPGPEHPLWPQVAMNLAETVRRTHGDKARSRSLGLEALRTFAYQAMLQSGTEHAISAARKVSQHAATVADWCLHDQALDDLVRALEAARGLALHAATTDRQVEELLRSAGDPALAERWRQANGTSNFSLAGLQALESVAVPDRLRHQVFAKLTEVSGDRLLDPPSLTEISDVLKAGGYHALVYLVPRSRPGEGMAVVVIPDEPVITMTLPLLRTEATSVVDRYQRALVHISTAGMSEPAARQFWTTELEAVCDWAWPAVGEQLVGLAQQRWPGQVPQIVLVPVGPLALVPWHAARRPVGRRYRYLGEWIALSTSPSARLLCDVVGRTAGDRGRVGIVADPAGDLRAAGIEAAGIQRSFYPDSPLLGRVRSPDGDWWVAQDGAGSASEVLDLIESGRASGILHLACHAVADQTHPDRSRLVLAHGEELPVRSLLDHRRVGRLMLDQVFLSACSTHLAGTDYDEAFSLASAFLAAGARTVFGSLWPVLDTETSVFMYLIHHYLHQGLQPLPALHSAQCWMLDPDRQWPRDMPPELAARAEQVNLADPTSWAAFVHLGR